MTRDSFGDELRERYVELVQELAEKYGRVPTEKELTNPLQTSDSGYLDFIDELKAEEPRRLLVFTTSTMGPAIVVACKPEDVMGAIDEYMVGADGVEDFTDEPEYVRQLLARFDKEGLYVDDETRAYVAGLKP